MIELKADDYIHTSENITIARRKANQPVAPHTHDFFELAYMSGGEGTQIINGTKYFVSRGDLLLFNIGDTHEVLPGPELHVVNILLKPEFVSEELTGSYDALDLLMLTSFDDFRQHIENRLPCISFTGKNLIELEHLLDRMFMEFNSKEAGYQTMLRSLVHILFTMLFRHMKNNMAADCKKGIFHLAPQILQYIEENYHKKISLNDLARESFYNPSYFGQLFKECFGQTPTEFIHRRRLQEAMQLLMEDTATVESISQAVGFKDVKQFYALFKDYTGMTPAKYRNHSRNHPKTSGNSPV